MTIQQKALARRDFLKLSPRPVMPAEDYWLHVSRSAMACRFEITVPSSTRNGSQLAIKALDLLEPIEQQLSVFRDNSEISFINRNASSRDVVVDDALFSFLLQCRDLSRRTVGAFDITSAPLTECWGFLKRQNRIPADSELEKVRENVGAESLIFLNVRTRSIRFRREGVKINLGSIGKGYALDRIAGLIRKNMPSALLNAGSSSLLAIGGGGLGHRGWTVGIRHPLNTHARLAVLKLRDCAMSTSGSEEQYFEHEGKRYGHVIDPRTGRPAEGVAGVTVVAQSAALSDALSTAFFVGGCQLARDYCDENPGTLAVILESGSRKPLVIGRNEGCEVEIQG